MLTSLVAVILAGGVGSRLKPLTAVRSKPSVPFGGIYRIIDFTLSNCLNSEIRQIFVITQYKSYSLSAHLKQTWSFLSRRLDQFIDEIPAQMQLDNRWYDGTADAIRQNLGFIRDASGRDVLILSGDHIYKMDYRQLHQFHEDREAALTVAAIRVPVSVAANRYGVLEVDESWRITGFQEKPAEPTPIPGTGDCLASMGIYLFGRDPLERNLDNDLLDFGKDVIPAMVSQGERVMAYDFTSRNRIEEFQYVVQAGHREKELESRSRDSDYWRDVGTLDAYWAANLDLVAASPRFNLYGERWALHSVQTRYPPAKTVHDQPGRVGQAINSILAPGVILSGSTVRQSVIGPGTYVHSYAEVERSVLFGGSTIRGSNVDTSIGRRCRVRNAIIDKSVRLSEGATVGYDREADEARGFTTADIEDGEGYVVAVPWNYRG